MTKKSSSNQLPITPYQLLLTGTAVAVLLALLLYWPTLKLPIIYDDLLHIRITKNLTLANVWLPTEAFGFYRPFTFVPLLIIRALFGYYPNWLFHGLNLVQHTLNVVLLIALSWRLWHNTPRAIASGLLFALFPFSYQAIAVYGHNVHPTIANLMLIGLHLYLSSGAEEQESRREMKRLPLATRHLPLATWFVFIIALLTHESAVLFGFLAGMVQWCRDGRFPPIRHLFNPRRSPWLWYIIAGVGYLVLYQFLPISRAPQVEAGGAALGKVLYLLQTAAYPFAWFAHWLPRTSATTIVLISSGLSLSLVGWAMRRRANRLPLLLGWGWWGLASILIALPLSTNYLLHGPRLLYLGSVGLTLAWPILLGAGERGSRGDFLAPRLSPLASLLFLLFILAANWQFVRGRLADYGRLTSPVDVITHTDIAPGAGVVIANLPQWLAPPRNTYPIGAELTAMLGDYLFAQELISENRAEATAVYPLIIPELLAQTDYPYGLHDESQIRQDGIGQIPVAADWWPQGSEVFVVSYLPQGPTAVHTGSLHPATNNQPLAHFTPYHLFAAEAAFCEGTVTAQLVWGQAGEIPATISMFVQVLSTDGRLLVQADGPPLNLPPAYLHLPPTWHITDQRQLPIPLAEQPAQLLVGVYDYTTGQRYPATTADQTPLPDDALALPLTTCE
ncbi:MAG: hypothetical protein H6658_01330 [Ardenticatenaceae bacterium]|nr:hypothetical protein [Ardenticatenaceae bacterium]